MVPQIHAESSAKKFGGDPEDYLAIHKLMDSTKAAFPDNRHRIITHNSWFTTNIIPMIFGEMITNSAGKKVSTKDIAEQHCLEDFGNKFIPSVQDWIQHLSFETWMNNGRGVPDRMKRNSGPQDVSKLILD